MGASEAFVSIVVVVSIDEGFESAPLSFEDSELMESVGVVGAFSVTVSLVSKVVVVEAVGLFGAGGSAGLDIGGWQGGWWERRSGDAW